MPRRVILLSACFATLLSDNVQSAEFIPLGFDPTVFGNPIDPLVVPEHGSVVVGMALTPAFTYDLMRWTRSSGPELILRDITSDVGVSGDGSTIVTGRGEEAIKITDGRLEVLPARQGVSSRASHISQDGSAIFGIVGQSFVRWTDEGTSTLFRYSVGHSDSVNALAAVSADGEVVVGTSHFRWTEEAGLQQFPRLAGEGNIHNVFGVSSDGRWAVGGTFPSSPRGATDKKALRWDGLSPPEELLPANEAWGAEARDVTADGSLVVGQLYFADERLDTRRDRAAGIWTEESGRMVVLQDLLVSEYGLAESLEGYHLTIVRDVTDDGRFMVGNSMNPAGVPEAWLVDFGPPAVFEGDYNDNGAVEQADLDLVLLHWGADASVVPDTWTNDLPTGAVDQDELDGVLLNWGITSTAVGAASVPEPSAWFLTLACTVGILVIRTTGSGVFFRGG